MPKREREHEGTRKMRLTPVGLCLIALVFLTNFIAYRLWRRGILARIHDGSRTVETSAGSVEYQINGNGPAVIFAHGTPGGYEQGIAFRDFLKSRDYLMVSPSRPGYLRTPLASGPSPADQADLYAALLDSLGIEKASLIGFSGGSLSVLQFALRHPERCHRIVIISGISQQYDPHEHIRALSPLQRLLARLVEFLLVWDPFLYIANPITRMIPYGNAVVGMLNSGTHYYLRKIGYENDIWHFARAEPYPLEKIQAPTLIVHGFADTDVPFEHARLLIERIPDAHLLALVGDHSAFYKHAKTVMPRVLAFLIGE